MDDKVRKTRIQDIFQTMEYGESVENTAQALEWINTKESTIFAYVKNNSEAANGIPLQIKNCINEELLCTIYLPEIDTIKKIIANSNNKTKWIDTKPLERAKALNKLAVEIEKNADFLSQIEIVSRGILGKDTKTKAIPLLAQYFYYYAGFAVKYNQENPTWKPEGIVVGVISNENAFSNLGLILAPALAAGYNIVLHVGTKLCLSATFIFELAKKAGIPDDVLRLIPSNDGELFPYLNSDNVSVLTLFVDLHNESYLGINSSNKKILNLSSYRTPAIIFDDADLDSASTSIIDSAWGYGGLLPWSVNTVLVQENIFEEFLSKIKSALGSTKIGLGNNKLADISYPSHDSLNKLNGLVSLAKSRGVEVFQTGEGLCPTLFIGGIVQTNRVLSADEEQEANAVTVLAFRSIDEAVNLANNRRQGLAASIWSENIGLVNEVSIKLKVSNIWVNSHGLTTAEVSLSPIKDSGVGYFGGKDGFYEYVQSQKKCAASAALEEPQKLNNSLANSISAAKKSQENWCNVSKINKGKLLLQFADYIDKLKESACSSINKKWLDDWIVGIYECITESNPQSHNILQSGFNVTSTRTPRGVVVIETGKESDSHNIKLILSALFEGNSVILLNNCNYAEPFYKMFSQKLPSGVLNVVSYNLDNVKTAAVHKELNAYFGDGGNPVFAVLHIKHCKIFANVLNEWTDVYRKVTFTKNIWSNVGKSSTCNLSSY